MTDAELADFGDAILEEGEKENTRRILSTSMMTWKVDERNHKLFVMVEFALDQGPLPEFYEFKPHTVLRLARQK